MGVSAELWGFRQFHCDKIGHVSSRHNVLANSVTLDIQLEVVADRLWSVVDPCRSKDYIEGRCSCRSSTAMVRNKNDDDDFATVSVILLSEATHYKSMAI